VRSRGHPFESCPRQRASSNPGPYVNRDACVDWVPAFPGATRGVRARVIAPVLCGAGCAVSCPPEGRGPSSPSAETPRGTERREAHHQSALCEARSASLRSTRFAPRRSIAALGEAVKPSPQLQAAFPGTWPKRALSAFRLSQSSEDLAERSWCRPSGSPEPPGSEVTSLARGRRILPRPQDVS
jgi:hypothetical protein